LFECWPSSHSIWTVLWWYVQVGSQPTFTWCARRQSFKVTFPLSLSLSLTVGTKTGQRDWDVA
jgi:hypothetical protein